MAYVSDCKSFLARVGRARRLSAETGGRGGRGGFLAGLCVDCLGSIVFCAVYTAALAIDGSAGGAGGPGFVWHRGSQVALAVVLAACPPYGSVRVAQLVGREDVWLQAQEGWL